MAPVFSKKSFADECDDLKSAHIDILTGHVGTLDPNSIQFIVDMPTYVMENLGNSKIKNLFVCDERNEYQ